MPAARESLLDAAYTALTERPWTAVRMVEVAAAAGVSRQTLYNEFGSKEGLARALVRRETDHYLAGVARALSRGAPAAGARGDAAAPIVAAAAWTVRTARANPLVRAALTGCWGDRLPPAPTGPAGPAPAGAPRPGVPAQRAAPPGEGPLPGPAELVGRFCDQAVAALRPGWPEEELPALGTACETAARLTLSWVLAPPAPGAAPVPGRVPPQRSRREPDTEAVSRLVRSAFARMTAGTQPADRS
ncbi:TetR family transcriptional regulator [Streptomyces sp. 2333.5]|uniref:TetR/AcrR family transcriptional regulator n=1 Tax=unclassified Streptomyces TaxID=2593676 RepID=UPI000898882E|nr:MULTISPECIES: helix-turn-helix domain-containing protein [unclassified Streptomyces]PJJ04364.1 TetR family transcriptional regulator [Streptomyces sp. 2333.5]SEE48761.1 transcriptional regulator, TetR family [Streptomyces sp. 2314.4]SEE75585.1 transcriptional regulator, TetR family [Streptomyces sp. 2112.2]